MTGATIEEGHLAYNGVMGVFLEEASVSHSKASRDPVESGAAVEEGFLLAGSAPGLFPGGAEPKCCTENGLAAAG